MTAGKASNWVIGTVVSAGLHGALLFGLIYTVKPNPTPPQNAPKSKLNVASYTVDQSKAVPRDAKGEKVVEADGDATGLKSGAIPQSDAVPSKINATKLEPTLNTSEALRPSNANTPLPQIKAQSKISKPQALDTTVMPQAVIEGMSIQLASTGSLAKPTPSITPPSAHAKAALAWVGDDGNIDPVSLSAIQAFMQPSDLATSKSNAGNVRDGIEGILASIPCSRLQTSFDPDTGSLEIRGHIPEDGLRDPIREALQKQIGDAIPITQKLLILPRPQCGALSGISDVGLPQSNEQETNPRVIGPSGFAQSYTYTNGQRLELELTAPDYDAIVYVDYFTADGMVLHLQPNTIVPLTKYPAKAAFSVGKEIQNGPSLNLTITPPFGQEIAVAFAASTPLFDQLRPINEPAGPYLDELKKKVAIARAQNPSFKGEWVYFFISTKP